MPDLTEVRVIARDSTILCHLAFNMEPILPQEWLGRFVQLDPSIDEVHRVMGVGLPQGQLTLRVRRVAHDETASITDVLIGLPIAPPTSQEASS